MFYVYITGSKQEESNKLIELPLKRDQRKEQRTNDPKLNRNKQPTSNQKYTTTTPTVLEPETSRPIHPYRSRKQQVVPPSECF